MDDRIKVLDVIEGEYDIPEGWRDITDEPLTPSVWGCIVSVLALLAIGYVVVRAFT